VVKLFSFPSPRHVLLRFPVNNSNCASASITWFDLTKKFYTLKERKIYRAFPQRVRENFATNGRCMTRTVASISNKEEYPILRPIKDYRSFLKIHSTCWSDLSLFSLSLSLSRLSLVRVSMWTQSWTSNPPDS